MGTAESREEFADHSASAQHLANLVFLSYRFSQGAIGCQNRMLTYISENFYPGFMTDEQSPDIHERASKIIGPYFLNQAVHPATAIPWGDDSLEATIKTGQLVVNELAGLFDRFKDDEYMGLFSNNPVSIAASVIIMDADYLAREGGRSGDSIPLKIVVSPYTRDPYDSLFIKYGILGTDTNAPEFNTLFEQISKREVISELDEHDLNTLVKITASYIHHHPDMLVDARIVALQTLCTELQNAQR